MFFTSIATYERMLLNLSITHYHIFLTILFSKKINSATLLTLPLPKFTIDLAFCTEIIILLNILFK
jgi:hypothetical protein